MILDLRAGRRKRFSVHQNHPDWLHDQPSLLFSGCQGSFSWVKQVGHEVDHSPPSSSEVRNEWNFTFTPHICLHGVYRDNFTFLHF